MSADVKTRVEQFAKRMIKRLKDKQDKGELDQHHLYHLFSRLRGNVQELQNGLEACRVDMSVPGEKQFDDDSDIKILRQKATDAANYLFMIQDRIKKRVR